MENLLKVIDDSQTYEMKAKASYVVNKSTRKTDISESHVDNLYKERVTELGGIHLSQSGTMIMANPKDRLYIANKMRIIFR